jgi:hypothetical protein
MKNGAFWDVTPCDSFKNRRFYETIVQTMWDCQHLKSYRPLLVGLGKVQAATEK